MARKKTSVRSYPAGAKAAWNLKSWKPDCLRSPV
jgi:hypothetical protein